MNINVPPSHLNLEACVGSLHQALAAEQQGASQIELCDRLDLDGTSPPIDLVRSVVTQCNIPIKVIINPKPYDYHYDDSELTKICKYIDAVSKVGVAGIVFGPINANGMPDTAALDTVKNTTNLPLTYHKAIDTAPDIIEAATALAEHGAVDYILSSGGAATAILGYETLLHMKEILSTSHVRIIAAGRITKTNLSTIHDRLALRHYHGKLIVGPL